ncbi:MAG: hypothetical protein AMJ72_00275 [Acidithiobacillales bacterium SM1_46]|nr:MAG: hypothetical protein AMJ72_00275 [Acidithiobacillales bacterium SM1_46]
MAAVVAGAGQAYKAYQTKKLKDQEAKGYREAATRRMAAATREAGEEERNRKRIHSRAIAVSAASGAGVDDPSIVALLGDLNAEGEYRVMSRLWAGQNDAEGLQFRAEAAEREGKTAIKIGVVNTITAAMSTYSAFGGSFGGGGGGGASGYSVTTSQPGGMEIPGYGYTSTGAMNA